MLNKYINATRWVKIASYRTRLIIINLYIIIFKSCNGGSNPTIYSTAVPPGNGLNPENNHSTYRREYSNSISFILDNT